MIICPSWDLYKMAWMHPCGPCIWNECWGLDTCSALSYSLVCMISAAALCWHTAYTQTLCKKIRHLESVHVQNSCSEIILVAWPEPSSTERNSVGKYCHIEAAMHGDSLSDRPAVTVTKKQGLFSCAPVQSMRSMRGGFIFRSLTVLRIWSRGNVNSAIFL
jgi:hypothetical protein